jgi:cytochrome b subunit of formate dehydrogenase
MKEGCHPNENPKFGFFFTHAAQTPPKPWGGVKVLFLGLLGLLAVVFLAHSLRYEEPRPVEGVKTPQKVEVLDQIDLILHFFAIVAVVMALATGPFLQLPGLSSVDPASFGFTHGAAGIIGLLVWVFHFSRVTIEWLEGRSPWGLLPGIKDVKEMLRGTASGFGAGAPPQRGRFSYRERFSYAGFVLAAPLMVVTGYIVGHPTRFSGLLGPSGVMGAATLHSALGLLILLPLVWHLYFALFQPGMLWINGSFITGKTTFERVLRVRPDWARSIIEEITAGLEPPKEPENEEVTVESLLEKGNQAAREGQYKVACYHFLKALELYPGYSQALYNLGVVLKKSGDTKRSIMVLEKFLKQDPFGPASGKARELIDEMKKKGGA